MSRNFTTLAEQLAGMDRYQELAARTSGTSNPARSPGRSYARVLEYLGADPAFAAEVGEQLALQQAAEPDGTVGSINRPKLLASLMGAAGEGGEALDLLKKVIFHGHPLTPEVLDKAAKELGDVLWYVADGARALGLSLSALAAMNIRKLAERYPDGFSDLASLNRPKE